MIDTRLAARPTDRTAVELSTQTVTSSATEPQDARVAATTLDPALVAIRSASQGQPPEASTHLEGTAVAQAAGRTAEAVAATQVPSPLATAVSKALQGKVCIITGGGSGIGRELALRFAQEGAKVGVMDLTLQSAGKVVDEIHQAGGEAMPLAADVSNEEQVDAAVDAAALRWGGIDVMVSNAGIQHIESVDKLKLSDWHKMMNVHLDGAFLTTRAALRHMYPENKGGSILYIGSVHSHEASKLKAPYVTAKHGLLGLAKVVAKEGAEHNVRTNVICPGFVRTPLVEKQIPEQAAALGISEGEVVKNVMLKDTIDGEFTTVQDIADTAVFLASFPSSALSGQSITVSHGWHMQ